MHGAQSLGIFFTKYHYLYPLLGVGSKKFMSDQNIDSGAPYGVRPVRPRSYLDLQNSTLQFSTRNVMVVLACPGARAAPVTPLLSIINFICCRRHNIHSMQGTPVTQPFAQDAIFAVINFPIRPFKQS